MANSYTPPDRSTYDPGWNDPPPMPSMTPQPVVAGKPRISLNKRVAFPMQSSGTTSANVKTTAEGLPLPFSTAKYQPPPQMPTIPIAEAPVMPPPIAPPPIAPPALNPPSIPIKTPTTEAVNDGFDSATAREFSNSIFARLIDGLTIDVGKLSEIRKRLELLDQMWQENKLNAASQQILFQLAKALENKVAVEAMEQHRLLVTQHTNVSTQWAPALRQLILSISPETEADSQNAPAVLPDTDVVQFVDVSAKPTVMDHIPIIPQEPINLNPLPASSSDVNLIPSENALQSNCENSPKPKFGRILHL
ncbi:steroid receptor RNA activator 1-like [Contarinia nasturtii]|uniref:steroid receptor RNA activator 1-like n=1 Tax=Contarinia nasturtii TaxID=265458 RepID=UPI0012D3A3F4|nr:steroid receptor RNA activator 1-like [Contarinia nasturtii]